MIVTGIPYVQGRNSYSDPDGAKYGIAIHNTSNTASAEAEASYATRRTDGISSHFYCDGDSVIQSLDTAARAGHAGSRQGNDNAVAVEITGVNGWSRQQWLDGVAWELLGRVLAQVCRAYGIAVRRASVAEMQATPKVKAFYSHDDMRRAWGGTTHDDPGPNFPWDRLFGAVNAAFNPVSEDDMGLTTTEHNEIVKGDLDKDNVLHWRLRGIQDSDDPAIVNGPFGRPPTPGLKQLAEGMAKLADGLAALNAKIDAIEEGGGGLSDEDRAALEENTAAVKALNSRLATP